MNRLLIMLGILFVLIVPQNVQAQATTTQYPNPHRQTMWNNLTDGIHTIGQNPQQAAWTKRKLRDTRTRNRLSSIDKANHAKYVAQRQAWINSQNNQQ